MISSYFNSADPRDEWTELIVVKDNIDIRNWSLQDNNSAQTTFQPLITFNSIPLWNNLRGGTIILIWHRMAGSSGSSHPTDNIKQDGYIEVSANDPTYFNGGSFGTAPLYAGNTLNIAAGGDLLQLLNASGTFVHALGHKTAFGSSWTTTPTPKLNHKASLVDGEAVLVCPGGQASEYGYQAPQDGTNWTAKSSVELSPGLPNCGFAGSTNSNYWRWDREPRWLNPVLNGSVNTANTQVTLTWNGCDDPFPSDGIQGYMLLRSNIFTAGNPLDGHTYNVGDNCGGATVIALIPSSQTVTYTDNITVPCTGGMHYRIYAYRFDTDPLGNDFNVARGRAYNIVSFGIVQVTTPAAVAPSSATVDRNNFCADDPGNITLSAGGGSGAVLNWYSGSCGGTLLGSGSGAGNSLTIPSPAATTTYYARWESNCGPSPCADVTVTVLPSTPVSVSITASQNPICTGTPVTFTATPTNQGSAPAYEWFVNGAAAGTNTTTYSYTPADGDDVHCVLTSSAACATSNPATSNHITMSVSSSIPVSVSIDVSQNPVCTGTPVTFTATPSNPGSAPTYQWFINGSAAGSSLSTHTYTPADGDDVHCVLTSSASCASSNPATSNNIIMSVSSAIPVSVTIAASQNPVCSGTPVVFSATAVNQGNSPSYQWKVNGTDAGGNNSSYSYLPVDGDLVLCIVTSSASCATGSPASSNTVTMAVNSALPAGAALQASPGDTICPGTSVTFTATPVNGGAIPSFQWYLNGNPAGGNNASWSIVPSDGDRVWCRVTSSLSCATGNPAVSDTITISTTTSLAAAVTVSADHPAICPGTFVTLTASSVNGGVTPQYAWLVNGIQVLQGNSPVYSSGGLAPGDQVVCRMTSSLSCVIQPVVTSAPLILAAAPEPLVVLSAQESICTGTVSSLDAGAGFNSYQWQNGSTARYMDILSEGTYWVVVTDSLACSGSDSVMVKNCAGIFIPNAFTPDGDGLNDSFRIVGSPDEMDGFSMQVFSRWGELVFESTRVTSGWDGRAKDVFCPPGTYAWKVSYTSRASGSSGETVTLSGTVHLIK